MSNKVNRLKSCIDAIPFTTSASIMSSLTRFWSVAISIKETKRLILPSFWNDVFEFSSVNQLRRTERASLQSALKCILNPCAAWLQANLFSEVFFCLRLLPLCLS